MNPSVHEIHVIDLIDGGRDTIVISDCTAACEVGLASHSPPILQVFSGEDTRCSCDVPNLPVVHVEVDKVSHLSSPLS